ncbi:Kelch repeat-containing protein [Maricaulis sp. CAU 1757]
MTGWTRRTTLASLLATGLAAPLAAPARAQTCRSEAERWLAASPLPVRTQEIYPAVLDERIYVAGGLSPDAPEGQDGILERAFVWTENRDAATRFRREDCLARNGWREIAPLPEPRHHPNLVAHDGAIYAVGGFRAGGGGRWQMLDRLTRYDPDSDTWTELAPMPRPFAETVAHALPTGLHVATGRQPSGTSNANWSDHADSAAHYVYDARSDRWHEAEPNPVARNSAAGGVLSNRLHVVGGRLVNAGNRADHQAFDTISGRWQTLAPLPQAQGGLAAAVVGGRLYAFGGEYFDDAGGGVYAECWIYEPGRDIWSAGPDMAVPRHGLGGVAVDGRVFAVAGATEAGGRGTSNRLDVLLP